DNDLMTRAGNGDFILTSDVKLRLDAIGPLSGVSSEYVGAAYKLFNDGDYDDITPTLLPVVWNIGGTDYNVGFNNTLSTDGTLTVSSLQAVPEPASVSALVAAGVLLASRRRRRC